MGLSTTLTNGSRRKKCGRLLDRDTDIPTIPCENPFAYRYMAASNGSTPLTIFSQRIMRNTSGYYDTLLRTIEGRLQGKRVRGRPRRTWVHDLRDWTGSKRYNEIKRAAEKRDLHGEFATHSSGRNNE